MGTWGEKVWETDEAADWFSTFIKKVDTKFVLDEAEESLKCDDNYETIRAIAYILGHLGKTYIWPIDEMERLQRIKAEMIVYYQEMLEEESDYMALWENDETVKKELFKELELLKESNNLGKELDS